MNNLPQISEWKRIFVDTSFIIDSVRDLSIIEPKDPKYSSIKNTHGLLDRIKGFGHEIKWITSSIVLSELSKFENKDAIDELQRIFNSPEVEIVNFTPQEAMFIVKDMANYIEQKHVSRYVKELASDLAKSGVFNPKSYITNDALIIACAKSRKVDVVLTSDEKSFVQIAKQVELPVLLTKDLPVDLHGDIDHHISIQTNY